MRYLGTGADKDHIRLAHQHLKRVDVVKPGPSANARGRSDHSALNDLSANAEKSGAVALHGSSIVEDDLIQAHGFILSIAADPR